MSNTSGIAASLKTLEQKYERIAADLAYIESSIRVLSTVKEISANVLDSLGYNPIESAHSIEVSMKTDDVEHALRNIMYLIDKNMLKIQSDEFDLTASIGDNWLKITVDDYEDDTSVMRVEWNV